MLSHALQNSFYSFPWFEFVASPQPLFAPNFEEKMEERRKERKKEKYSFKIKNIQTFKKEEITKGSVGEEGKEEGRLEGQ